MTALLLMTQDTYVDQFDDRRLGRLRSLVKLTEPSRVDDLDELGEAALAKVEVLLTGWGAPPLTAERLALLPQLRAVVHCAGSVRQLVSPRLWERAIRVSSAAEVNAIPVAEFTFAAVVMAGKKAPFLAADARTHRSDWTYRTGRGELGNLGLTVGVIGYSRIGRRVVHMLQQLADMTCLVADPYANPTEIAAAGGELVPLNDLLARVDVLSIHAPDLPSTHHLVGGLELALLRDHATVINTARGALIDTAALEIECASGRLNAILDVTDPEPLPATSVLYDLPNVMITPHVAGSLGGEIRRMTDTALDELERLVRGDRLAHEVVENDLALIA